MVKMSKIEVVLKFDSIRVYFDSILFVHIKRSELLGIQSWQYGKNNYYIEFTMVGNSILTEYDDFEKFKVILTKLDEIL